MGVFIMNQKIKTIQKVERFFTDDSNYKAEDIIAAYHRAIIDTVIAQELSLQEAPSSKEVA
jgi:hypothetical protein